MIASGILARNIICLIAAPNALPTQLVPKPILSLLEYMKIWCA